MAENALGYSGKTWLEALSKKQTDSISGKGGVESYIIYFGNIDFISELVPLRQQMKADSIYFETALSLCEEKMRTRPERLRTKQIIDLMGCICNCCGAETTLWQSSKMGGTCVCGGTYESAYASTMQKLLSKHILPTPEAVIMSRAYDRLADAYKKAYIGMYLVMDATAGHFHWEHFQVRDAALRNYWDKYFLGRILGEQHINDEEKKTLQFISRGPPGKIPLDSAGELIDGFMGAAKYAYLYEVLGISAAYQYYLEKISQYNSLYNEVNSVIRLELTQSQEDRHPTVVLKEAGDGTYAPCWKVDPQCWESGKLSSNLRMSLAKDLPIHPKFNYGAIVLWLGPQGSGKSFGETSIATDSYLNTDEFFFSPLGDKSNNFTLACLPLCKYNRRTSKLQQDLKEKLGIEPQGMPLLHITVLKRGERIEDRELNPPTIFDVILEVEDYETFEAPFPLFFEKLREINEWYGRNRQKPKGIMTVRNLDRFNRKDNTNIDLRILVGLLDGFGKYRKSHPQQPSRVFIDELSYSAASQINIGGGDASKSGGIIDDNAKETRRNNAAFDAGTQIPKEIIGNIRKGMTTCFFKELGQSNDRPNSEIDFLLGILKLKNPEIRPIIRSLNEAGLPKGMWFGWDRESREINIYNPCPPICTLNDTEHTPRQILRRFEKKSFDSQGLREMGLKERQLGNRKILLSSWKEVPVIRAENSERREKRENRILRGF